MCRLLAYLGPAMPLSRLICEPDHSLVAQSFRPRHMINGTVNADGFGLGWYQPGEDRTPAIYKSVMPIWADANLLSIGPRIRSPHVIACVRGATGGQPTSYENTQPFVYDRYSFVHNGSLQAFREIFMRPMREALDDRSYRVIHGSTDSEHIFATWLHHLGDRSGPQAMADALETTVTQVNALARAADARAYLTILISDGESVVATRHGSVDRTASLFVIERDAEFQGGTVIASEPLSTSDRWREIPPHTILQFGPHSA